MRAAPLSIVIPAYNEAGRIGATLDAAVAWLEARGHPFELLIVDDGSADDTAGLVRGRADDRVRLLAQGRNRGKGAAVRAGVRAAAGDPVVFCDADGATPIEELDKLLGALGQVEVAIGSRAIDERLIDRRQSPARELMGKTFNRLARALVPVGAIRDTQCGFKAFRAAAARAIFERQTLDGFAFDVEVLWLARRLGYRIAEVPVRWSHRDGSKVTLARSSAHMLADLVRLRLRRGDGA